MRRSGGESTWRLFVTCFRGSCVSDAHHASLSRGECLELSLKFLSRHLTRRLDAHHARRLRSVCLHKAKELFHGCLLRVWRPLDDNVKGAGLLLSSRPAPSGDRLVRSVSLARACSTCQGRRATQFRNAFVERVPTQSLSRVIPAGRQGPRPARYWEVRIFWTYRRTSFCEGSRTHPGAGTRR